MSTKRYQIFLSSTFSDLEDERKKVMQALLEMDCIPSGMEFFPASDEATFEFIKTIIDESDYYILILGGRYGSVADDRLSYTEKEYDYAKKIGKPVLSFVRQDIDDIKVSQTDNDPKLALRIKKFRDKVLKSGTLSKLWDNSDQLSGQVILTLNQAIKRSPQPGWIRGNQQPSTEILEEINELRKENEKLRKDENIHSAIVEIPDIVGLDAEIMFRYQYGFRPNYQNATIILSLNLYLQIVGHRFRTNALGIDLSDIADYIRNKTGRKAIKVEESDIRLAFTQLELMKILIVSNIDNQTAYTFTPNGLSEYLSVMAIRKDQ